MFKSRKSFKHRKQRAQAQGDILSPLAPRLRVLGAITLIFAAGFIAYLPVINGGFILDDSVLVTNNPLVKTADGLTRFWRTTEQLEYYPLTYNIFWLEWRLWETNPGGYHATNLILHIFESLLIWVILRRLSITGAFLAGLLFAVHPINVESVAWIAQLRNMTAMLFFLLSILWYLRSCISEGSEGAGTSRSHFGPQERAARARRPTFSSFILHPSSFHFWYWLSLAAFVLAMLGKGSVAVLPALVLGIVWWLRPLTRRDLWRVLPFFAVTIALTAANVWFQTHGTEIVIRDTGFADRLAGAGCVVWFYLYKALLPINLAFVYRQWHIEAERLLWWLPLLAVLALTAVLWRCRKTWSRPLLFAWGFFCVALVPVMGFADVGFMQYSLVADHYQHIALIGLVAAAAALWSAWSKQARGVVARRAAHALAVVTAGILMLLTWRQCSLYKDPILLYRDTLKKNPECWMIHSNLGLALKSRGQYQEAVEHFKTVLRIKPDCAIAYINLGNIFRKEGHVEEAIEQYKQALLFNPNLAEAYSNLGAALVEINQAEEAVRYYQNAMRLNPGFIEAQYNLAEAYAKLHRSSEAVEAAEKAVALARSQGQTAMVEVIETWLNAYRAGLSGMKDSPPTRRPDSKTP